MASKYKEIQRGVDFDLPNWTRIDDVNHEDYRDSWVRNMLLNYCNSNSYVLDVGCGTQPFRGTIEDVGAEYKSHDFSGYKLDSKSQFGLHNDETPIKEIDIVCDITEIPQFEDFDVLLCTEVLEHVPNPAEALNVITGALKKGGYLILSVPGLSWVHQAPYYFSSGLSPYWVNFHAERLGLEVVTGVAVGSMRNLLPLIMSPYETGNLKIVLKLIGFSFRYLTRKNNSYRKETHEAAILQILVVLKKN